MSISRQALAAALLEYDNENLPQYAQKDHRRSAIFSLIPPKLPKEYTLPAPKVDGDNAHDGVIQGRRPRAGSYATQMTHATRRPQSGMGVGTGMDRETVGNARMIQVQGEEEDDVDIDRWDLPDHLVTEEARPSSRQSQNQAPVPTVIPQRQSMQAINIPGTRSIARSFPSPITSSLQARAVSVHLESGEADIVEQLASRAMTPSDPRRRTISFETNNDIRRRTYSDLKHADSTLARSQQLRASAAPRASSIVGFPMHDQYPDMRIQEPVMVPLPASPSSSYHPRPMSAMSRGSRGGSFELDRRVQQYGEEAEEEEEALAEPNPFALPAPKIENASRFDPKATATLSTDDLLSVAPSADLRRPMSTANLARLNRMNDGTATPAEEAEPVDPNDPLGILAGRPEYEDLPSPEAFGKSLIPSKYGRRTPKNKHDLLRPKTLIMPATLIGTEKPAVQKHKVPEGFIYGDKPLPVGARSSILTPHTAVANLGDGRTFGAAVAAEQQEMDRMMWEAEEMERMAQQEARRERMPGKLYGTSLMDQLEARKLQMRGKQRQFGGDSRPAMMARQSMLSIPHSPDSPAGSPDKGARAPLLSFDSNGNLDAAASPDKQAFDARTLHPDANRMSYPHPGMSHSQSAHTNLGAVGIGGDVGLDGRPRLAKSKSVFGVDTIWEREMAKLKIMQEAEAREKADREEQERIRTEKKGNRKLFWAGGGKGKEKAGLGSPASQGMAGSFDRPPANHVGPASGISPAEEALEIVQSPPKSESAIHVSGGSPIRRAPDAPPILQFSPEKKKVAPPPADQEEETGPDLDDAAPSFDPLAPRHLGTFASGQQVPLTPSPEPESSQPLVPVVAIEDDESSDEEVPLSKLKAPTTTSTYGALPNIRLNSDVSGSLGLSVPVLPTSISPKPASFVGDALANFGVTGGDEEEDDDVPLGVRQSRLMPPSGLGSLSHKTSQPLTERPEEEKEEIEDDLPLGFKHAAAVSRRVASGSNMPNPSTGQSHPPAMSASASMYGHPNQMPMGMGGMGFAQSPSVYGMGMPGMYMGMPQMGMGMGMGGMGMPSMYGNMGMPMGGGIGAGMGMPQGQMAMMQGPMPPTEMPGANIDSWRKGVRAPSTVGGESRVSGTGMS